MYPFKSTSARNSESSHHSRPLSQQDHSKSLSEWWVLYNNLKPYRFSLGQAIVGVNAQARGTAAGM